MHHLMTHWPLKYFVAHFLHRYEISKSICNVATYYSWIFLRCITSRNQWQIHAKNMMNISIGKTKRIQVKPNNIEQYVRVTFCILRLSFSLPHCGCLGDNMSNGQWMIHMLPLCARSWQAFGGGLWWEINPSEGEFSTTWGGAYFSWKTKTYQHYIVNNIFWRAADARSQGLSHRGNDLENMI